MVTTTNARKDLLRVKNSSTGGGEGELGIDWILLLWLQRLPYLLLSVYITKPLSCG